MKCGRIRMLRSEIKLDQIRPHREYWRPLGNREWKLFYLIWKQVGGSKSVCAFYCLLAVVRLMNKTSFIQNKIRCQRCHLWQRIPFFCRISARLLPCKIGIWAKHLFLHLFICQNACFFWKFKKKFLWTGLLYIHLKYIVLLMSIDWSSSNQEIWAPLSARPWVAKQYFGYSLFTMLLTEWEGEGERL